MECMVTIDEKLLDEARRALGTDDVQHTIEVSLREAIRTRAKPVELPRFIRTDEELQQFLRDAQRPRTEAELARRAASIQAAETHRLHVGQGFNVVEELREMRRRSEAGLAAELDDDERP
jgi:hypothetical protein